MGMESGPEFRSDRIEKKEILSQAGAVSDVEAETTRCLRELVNEVSGREVDPVADSNLICGLQDSVSATFGDKQYQLSCKGYKACERQFIVDVDNGVLQPVEINGTCFEIAVKIGRTIFPNPDDIY